MQNEDHESYLLESIDYAGQRLTSGRSLVRETMTTVIVVNAPVPPFETPPDSIKFTVSRLGEKYEITQPLNTSTRADGLFGLDGVVPMPSSIVRL
jgi:hypothetical protein